MKERLLEVIDLLNHEKEDLDQLCKDVSFPETRLASSAAMTNRRVREILEEVLEGIDGEWINLSLLQSNIHFFIFERSRRLPSGPYLTWNGDGLASRCAAAY